MKRWLAVLFITVMADVHAAWVPYGETELVGNIYYIDPDTLRKSEAGYIFNILSNYSVPIRESFATFQSVQSQVELDCRNCKTACKTFQGPGEKSVEKFPPQVVQ